jgi:hypothetical protein
LYKRRIPWQELTYQGILSVHFCIYLMKGETPPDSWTNNYLVLVGIAGFEPAE